MSTTTKKPIENPNHWSNKRSAPIDRSKRVAPGGEIKSTNILSGTRERVTHDYNMLHRKLVQYNEDNMVNPWMGEHQKDKKVASKNILEKRSNLSNITNKMAEMNLEKKTERKRKSVNKESMEKRTEEKKVEETKEPVQETATRRRSINNKRRSRSGVKIEYLNSTIIEEIKRLGGTPGTVGDLEYKHSLEHTVKVEPWLQVLLQTTWPDNGKVLSNEDLEIFQIQLGQFALPKEEATHSAIRNKETILIGDGNVILAVSQKSGLTEDKDIILQVIDDENQVEEVKLSEFLKGADWEDLEEDETSASVEV
jgi:hypothetical protein